VNPQKKIGVPTPTTQAAPHNEVLQAIRSCCFATTKVVNYDRKQDQKDENRTYGALFFLLFKRRPTPDEIDYMTGGSAGHCQKCKKELTPNPNGTMNSICACEKGDL